MDRSKPPPPHRTKPDDGRPGSDFLQLRVEAAPAGGRADWLANAVRAAIADGRLPAGSTVPASRLLAADLGVSRGVVTEAYQRLVDDGHLAGRGRRGTVVTSGGRPAAVAPVPPRATPARDWAPFTADTGDNGMFDRLRSAPARIDLTPGAPDLAAFPRAGWLRAERAVLQELSADAFGYPQPAGAPAFRRALAGWLARNRGMSVGPEQVIVVAGVAQALALLARVLHAEGVDRIAVEDPGSRGAREQLHNWGMTTTAVAVDDAGIRVDELTASGASTVLVTPAHQFPMGVVLDGGRRRELLAWASSGGLIIEDDYDAEHRYDRPPTTALQSMLPDRVCYAGSVSKLLAPALRIGWLVVPPRYHDAVVAAKRESDLGNAVLPQLVLARMFDDGQMERHLRAVRRRHRARRDAMVTALRRHLPMATVHGAAAGLHLTITLPAAGAGSEDGVGSNGEGSYSEVGSDVEAGSDVEVAAAALAAGVKVHPLSWHRRRPGPNGLVLGYAASSPGEIAVGIEILAQVLNHRR